MSHPDEEDGVPVPPQGGRLQPESEGPGRRLPLLQEGHRMPLLLQGQRLPPEEGHFKKESFVQLSVFTFPNFTRSQFKVVNEHQH
jgi:hypothetical protein